MTTRKELVHQLDNTPTKEPALATGVSVTSLVAALYVILRFAFPKIPDDVLDAILAILAILVPFITSWIIRSKVWSPNSVNEVVDESVKNALEATEQLKNKNVQLIATESPLRPGMTREEIETLRANLREGLKKED